MEERLTIKPYARLITMLGDQLIKNEVVALTELIKNSYDADASWVKITFVNFEEDYTIKPESKIIIEDDGNGMNSDILKKHWLNPATPEKLRRKEVSSTTQKGRILQGEKGIGRFAIFKLGKNIKITTRRQLVDENGRFIEGGENKENTLVYDFTKYDNDFLTENGKDADLFLDNLEVLLSVDTPCHIVDSEINLGTNRINRKPHGTIIEISALKTNWTTLRVERVQKAIGKLQPIFIDEQSSDKQTSDFSVWFYKDYNINEGQNIYREQLFNCLENKSVFKIENGYFNAKDKKYVFDLNGQNNTLLFSDPEIKGLSQYKYFKNKTSQELQCGDFKFEFYIFDLNVNSNNPSKYYLDNDETKLIKEHRIYLYRDGIRVMPYGDSDDDWLNIDVSRGTIKADEFLSNDQVVGCIYISQEKNPLLKDKTNREGLIDEGSALEDFTNAIRLLLKYLRAKPYAQYLIEKSRKKEIDRIKKGRPSEIIEEAKEQFKNDEKALKILSKFESSYNKERTVLTERIEKTENLAAVGLSIETASHDVMLFLNKTLEQQDSLIRELAFSDSIDKDRLSERLTLIMGNLKMVQSLLKDVQLLFPSTKHKTKNINVKELIDKVHNLYKRAFNDNRIDVDYRITKTPLIVKTTDAVLLQVFINLFDNALYWLKTVNRERKILITVDGASQKVIFSDNGPGIRDEDKDYIFEAFYSGKGEDGRGLGLYIARQLLDRYDYTIDIAEFSRDKKLPGANFVLEFIREE